MTGDSLGPVDRRAGWIGVFDSGIGGLGVLRHIRDLLPVADIVYVADQGRAPYGTKDLHEVSEIAADVSHELIALGATTVVIACNTASAAALQEVRRRFPDTRFVGMEPAVKPAVVGTRSGIIGILATEATFQSELFESLVRRFGGGATILKVACPEWVEIVEAGMVDGDAAKSLVKERVRPLVKSGADTLVLGCTHFPFLLPLIQEVAGAETVIVDPAPAVARQTSLVHGRGGSGQTRMMSSGDPRQREALALALARLGMDAPVLAFPP